MNQQNFNSLLETELGITQPEKMRNSWYDYETAFMELTNNREIPVTQTNFHRSVRGRYECAALAYQYLSNRSGDEMLTPALSKPSWFESYVSSITKIIDSSWNDIEDQISKAIQEKVIVADALRLEAEKQKNDLVDYINELNDEIEQLNIETKQIEYLTKENAKFGDLLQKCEQEKRSLQQRLDDLLSERQQHIDQYDSEKIEHAKLLGRYEQLSTDNNILKNMLSTEIEIGKDAYGKLPAPLTGEQHAHLDD